MGLNRNALLASAAIAGAWIGLFSNIPLINCLNCLLFAWVWLGGIGAVYLYRRSENEPYLTAGQGALLGLLAGLFGALTGVLAMLILKAPLELFTGALRDFAGRRTALLTGFFFNTTFTFLRLLRDMAIYGAMGAVGGLLGVTLFWRLPASEE
jgi:hypothetical protein